MNEGESFRRKILYSFTDVNLTFIANGNYCQSHIKNTKLYTQSHMYIAII